MPGKIKIATIVGARPQFIKAAIVTQSIRQNGQCEEFYIHTGQHYDDNMSASFFRELSIPEPRYNLKIGSGNHGAQTGRMMMEIEPILVAEKPDWVLIYGDTNSTLAGALVAAKLKIPLAHVEAGERSFDMGQPEEINRILADRISTVCFTCTDAAKQHLQKEGQTPSAIVPVGDVMLDAAVFYGARSKEESTILSDLGVTHKEYILTTIHRPSNTDDPATLNEIISALGMLAEQNLTIVFPMHPRTKAAIARQASDAAQKILKNKNIIIIEPVGFLDVISLTKSARLVVTDSGGLQKEAYFHHTPCVVLRQTTEWLELVRLGWNHLVPALSKDAIISTCQIALNTPTPAYVDVFGDGHAADKILNHLLDNLPDSNNGGTSCVA